MTNFEQQLSALKKQAEENQAAIEQNFRDLLDRHYRVEAKP